MGELQRCTQAQETMHPRHRKPTHNPTPHSCASSRKHPRTGRELAQVFPQTFIPFLLSNQILLSAGQLVPAAQAQEAHAQSHASFLRQFSASVPFI